MGLEGGGLGSSEGGNRSSGISNKTGYNKY